MKFILILLILLTSCNNYNRIGPNYNQGISHNKSVNKRSKIIRNEVNRGIKITKKGRKSHKMNSYYKVNKKNHRKNKIKSRRNKLFTRGYLK